MSSAVVPPAEVKLPGPDPRKHKTVTHAPRKKPAADAHLAPLPPPINIRPAPGALQPRRAPQPATAF